MLAQTIRTGSIILALGLFIPACGFQLRGAAAVSWPQSLHTLQLRFDNSVGDELKQALGNTLMDRYGVKIVHQNAPELVISGVTRSRRVLSLSSTGKASEYLLHYQVNFTVNSVDNKPFIEQRSIKLQRDFLFDNTNILAKEIEEERLSKQMQTDAVRRILRSVIVLSKKQ